MKTTFRYINIVLVLVMLLSFATAVQAAGPGGTWASGINCQNLQNSVATISISFTQENSSTPVLTYNDTIPAGGTKSYYTPSSPAGIPSGFVGSAVVSSTTQIACNVNTINNGTGTSGAPYRLGTSSGMTDTQTGPTVFVPQVEKAFSNWNSYIVVQNTSQSSVTVNVTYKSRTGADVPAANESIAIPALSSHVFYQSDNAGLPSNFLGAAKVSAANGTSKLAVVANFYNSGANNSTSQFHSYNGFASGANKLFVPYIVRNYYGYNGGLTVQNVGGSATTVTVSFNFNGTTYNYTSGSIAPGAALALYTPNVAELNPVDALNVTKRFGSAIVQAASGGSVVAIVNQSNLGGAGVAPEYLGQGATYSAIANGSQTTKIFLPQIPDKAGGFWVGGFQITNTTGSSGTCTIVYNGVAGATENNVPLPANGFFSRYAPNVPNLTDGFNASVTVTCTQPVVGIANMAVLAGSGKLGDSFSQSNGLNQ